MIDTAYLIINKHGVKAIRKSKPSLGYDEIACKIKVQVPNELFVRPHIEASLVIKDIPNESHIAESVVNTKELIEQQTGAKIDFRIIQDEDKKEI